MPSETSATTVSSDVKRRNSVSVYLIIVSRRCRKYVAAPALALGVFLSALLNYLLLHIVYQNIISLLEENAGADTCANSEHPARHPEKA